MKFFGGFLVCFLLASFAASVASDKITLMGQNPDYSKGDPWRGGLIKRWTTGRYKGKYKEAPNTKKWKINYESDAGECSYSYETAPNSVKQTWPDGSRFSSTGLECWASIELFIPRYGSFKFSSGEIKESVGDFANFTTQEKQEIAQKARKFNPDDLQPSALALFSSVVPRNNINNNDQQIQPQIPTQINSSLDKQKVTNSYRPSMQFHKNAITKEQEADLNQEIDQYKAIQKLNIQNGVTSKTGANTNNFKNKLAGYLTLESNGIAFFDITASQANNINAVDKHMGDAVNYSASINCSVRNDINRLVGYFRNSVPFNIVDSTCLNPAPGLLASGCLNFVQELKLNRGNLTSQQLDSDRCPIYYAKNIVCLHGYELTKTCDYNELYLRVKAINMLGNGQFVILLQNGDSIFQSLINKDNGIIECVTKLNSVSSTYEEYRNYIKRILDIESLKKELVIFWLKKYDGSILSVQKIANEYGIDCSVIDQVINEWGKPLIVASEIAVPINNSGKVTLGNEWGKPLEVLPGKGQTFYEQLEGSKTSQTKWQRFMQGMHAISEACKDWKKFRTDDDSKDVAIFAECVVAVLVIALAAKILYQLEQMSLS